MSLQEAGGTPGSGAATAGVYSDMEHLQVDALIDSHGDGGGAVAQPRAACIRHVRVLLLAAGRCVVID